MFALVLIAFQAAALPSCQERYIDWRGSQSICHEWAESHAPILRSFQEAGVQVVVPNPAVLDRGGRLPASLAQLTSTASDRGLAGLTSLVSELASMLPVTKRLASLRTSAFRSASETCGSKTEFNAHYDSIKNEIVVCPLVTHAPLMAALPLIAHELGHAARLNASEAEADQIGFGLLVKYLLKHPDPRHGDLATYFFASVNCSRGEHTALDRDYLPSEERIARFLATPGLRKLARCE